MLPNKLKRGFPDLLIGCGRIEVKQGLDVSAHRIRSQVSNWNGFPCLNRSVTRLQIQRGGWHLDLTVLLSSSKQACFSLLAARPGISLETAEHEDLLAGEHTFQIPRLLVFEHDVRMVPYSVLYEGGKNRHDIATLRG